jgi:hypothetical protein
MDLISVYNVLTGANAPLIFDMAFSVELRFKVGRFFQGDIAALGRIDCLQHAHPEKNDDLEKDRPTFG